VNVLWCGNDRIKFQQPFMFLTFIVFFTSMSSQILSKLIFTINIYPVFIMITLYVIRTNFLLIWKEFDFWKASEVAQVVKHFSSKYKVLSSKPQHWKKGVWFLIKFTQTFYYELHGIKWENICKWSLLKVII
jgi:hypothetical protein